MIRFKRVITTITEKEEEYIKKAKRNSLKSTYVLSTTLFIMMLVSDFVFLSYGGTEAAKRNGMAIFSTALFSIGIFRFMWESYPVKKVYLEKEGIHIPFSKKLAGNMIRYEWIESVIMNEMGGGSLYVDIFFKRESEKYIYTNFQSRVLDPIDFANNLREKGIEVRILEPKFFRQKKRDFGWIEKMARGRKYV